jgi:hypothetical protein
MQIVRMETCAAFLNNSPMRIERIVERRPAFQSESKRTANHLHLPNQTVVFLLVGRRMHGHEVDNLADAVSRQKARHEYVCVRPVQLFIADLAVDRRDSKKASLFGIQNRAEDTG